VNCPHCKTTTKFRVKETRLLDGDIVRSRCCNDCGKVFGTRETVDRTLAFGAGKGTNPKSQANLVRPSDLLKVWNK